MVSLSLGHILRSEGYARPASVGMMFGGILNVIMDPILIFGFNLNVAGAAIATAFSNTMSVVFFVVQYLRLRGKSSASLNPRYFTFRYVKEIFSVGLASALATALGNASNMVMVHLASAYGDIPVAAYGVVKKIDQLPLNVSMGLCQGFMPLVGYNYASGNFDRMKKAFLFAFKIVLVGMTAICTFYFFQSEFMIRLFMDNDVIIGYGSRFLHGFCLGLPFLCLDFLCVGVFQATGMGRFSLLFAIMRKILLEIPALFILNALFPLYGLAYAQLTAEVVLSAAGMFVLYRLFGRRKSS